MKDEIIASITIPAGGLRSGDKMTLSDGVITVTCGTCDAVLTTSEPGSLLVGTFIHVCGE